jgi:nucleoside-diphosphate-sugar epimerase
MNILVTGHRGFLLKPLIQQIKKQYNANIIEYGDVRYYKEYTDIDIIIHFAGPINADKSVTTIIDGTVNMVRIAKQNNAHFVFASSQAIYDIVDEYGLFKKAMEKYIQQSLKHYTILRIPRVYDKSRKKGLMSRLHTINDKKSLQKVMTYITLKQFLKYTLKRIFKKGIVSYKNIKYKQNTIEELKQKYRRSFK